MTKDEKLISEARKRFDQAAEFERVIRNNAEEDFRFAAGDQWPDQIKQQRQATDRPCLTFNRLPQFIQQVIGDARQNKPGIKVSPVDSGADIEMAEVFEGLIRNIEAQSRAAQAYITALEHAVTGGFGHWRVLTEYSSDDSFDQDIRVRRIRDPFSVFWDVGAKEYDKSDAMWCFVSEWMPKEIFEQKYPKAIPSDWDQPTTTGTNNTTSAEWYSDDQVRLVEYWIKKPVDAFLGLLADGRTVDVPNANTQFIQAGEAQIPVVKVRKVKSHKVCRYVISGDAVLEEEKEFPCKYIPIVPVSGPEEYVDGQTRPRSLIRYAKDPMRMYNFWQTTIAEKIALAPKSPWLVSLGMVAGLEDVWNKANKENYAYLPFNADPDMGGSFPKRQDPASINAAEMQQSAQAIDDLKATMGMYDASLGNQGNESSGRAIIARQREGDTASYSWIDNLARSIQHTGRILIDMIPRIYDTARIIRILGDDDTAELVEINTWDEARQEFVFDLSRGKYDVEITVGPSYATKRMEAADSMLQFIQAVPAAGEVAGDLIAKAMDWPGADDIAERLKKMLPPGIADDEEDDPQAQIAQMMQQMQQMEQQNQEMQAELEKVDQAKIEAQQAETDRKQAETQSSLMMEKVQREGAELENLKKQIELMQGTDIDALVQQSVERALMPFLTEQQPTG